MILAVFPITSLASLSFTLVRLRRCASHWKKIRIPIFAILPPWCVLYCCTFIPPFTLEEYTDLLETVGCYRAVYNTSLDRDPTTLSTVYLQTLDL